MAKNNKERNYEFANVEAGIVSFPDGTKLINIGYKGSGADVFVHFDAENKLRAVSIWNGKKWINHYF